MVDHDLDRTRPTTILRSTLISRSTNSEFFGIIFRLRVRDSFFCSQLHAWPDERAIYWWKSASESNV